MIAAPYSRRRYSCLKKSLGQMLGVLYAGRVYDGLAILSPFRPRVYCAFVTVGRIDGFDQLRDIQVARSYANRGNIGLGGDSVPPNLNQISVVYRLSECVHVRQFFVDRT